MTVRTYIFQWNTKRGCKQNFHLWSVDLQHTYIHWTAQCGSMSLKCLWKVRHRSTWQPMSFGLHSWITWNFANPHMRSAVWQFSRKAGLDQRSHHLHLGRRTMTKASWAANRWQIQGTNIYEEKRDTDGGFTGIRHQLFFFLRALWDGLMANTNFVLFSSAFHEPQAVHISRVAIAIDPTWEK